MSVRVGHDLVSVSRVEDSLSAHGDRWTGRIFSARELADTGGTPERLAARFAAKEAAIKVLRPGRDQPVPWADIEVVRTASGAVELDLTGSAAGLAEDRGLSGWAVSLTHEAGFAAAVVVAEEERA